VAKPKDSAKEPPSESPAAKGANGKPAKAARLKSDGVGFAHESERQFARLLDFYQIEWDYEPTSFDLEQDEDGNVIQRFTPDFYLPSWDMYIEITTLNQKLVTKKNRKIRRLRELYPEVNCKIFYQRDYLSLVRKYGLEDKAG
jgi:hypoxanthine phosphoribosyltransferase